MRPSSVQKDGFSTAGSRQNPMHGENALLPASFENGKPAS